MTNKESLEYLMSDEGQEEIRKGLQEYFEATKAEREKLEQETLERNNTCKFALADENEWNSYVEKNKDPYGKAVLIFANEWAFEMEKLITDKFDLTDKQIDECAHKADEIAGGITGFMYGAAIATLKSTWKYGKELNRWHNKKYGKENSEGTVNPAVLTIG